MSARAPRAQPTAEAIFADQYGMEVASAGTAADAVCPVSSDLLEWADDVFVMERRHKTLLQSRFGRMLAGKHVVCLGIADHFDFMQPELISLLEAKVVPLLRTSSVEESR